MMINFEKKNVSQLPAGQGGENRFEQIRRAADEGHENAKKVRNARETEEKSSKMNDLSTTAIDGTADNT